MARYIIQECDWCKTRIEKLIPPNEDPITGTKVPPPGWIYAREEPPGHDLLCKDDADKRRTAIEQAHIAAQKKK